MKRRYTTRAEDRAYLQERFEDATRQWAVGDLVRTFQRGYDLPPSRIARFDGDIAVLEDGSHGHRSQIRRVQ